MLLNYFNLELVTELEANKVRSGALVWAPARTCAERGRGEGGAVRGIGEKYRKEEEGK